MNIVTDFATSKVGDGATVHGYSDSKACTIVAISEKKITVQYDTAKLLNGAQSGEPDAIKFDVGGFSAHCSGTQRWETTPNPEGGKETFSLRKWKNYKGEPVQRWAPVGSKRQDGYSLSEGRHHHYDFNF